MSRIVPLSTIDPLAVDALLDAAFGAERRGRTAYRIREGMAALPGLSFAALGDDGTLAGTLQSWPAALREDGGAETPVILLGPVAVDPALQRGGIGRVLMARFIELADATGAEPQVLIGDPEYYGRFFGFTADGTGAWALPGPVERRRLLARSGGRLLPEHARLGPRGWTGAPSPR